MMHAPNDDIAVAVGILSTLSAFSRRALSTAAHSATRRTLVRNTTYPGAPGLALRFLVAWPSTGDRVKIGAKLQEEQARHGDMVLLNMTENFLLCPLKYLLWLRVAPTLFPSAKWIACGDDDIYLQLDHLATELRLVGSLTNASTQPVLWGLITWKSFMNSLSYDTSTGFTGWLYTDAAAVGRRRAVHKCLSAAEDAAETAGITRVMAPSDPGVGAATAATAAAAAAAGAAGGSEDYGLNVTGLRECNGLGKALTAVRRRSIHPNPPWCVCTRAVRTPCLVPRVR